MANLLSRWGRTQVFPAYVEMYDDGSLVVSPDGSTTYTLTSAILAGLTKISGYVWDVSAAATGAAYAALGANLAAAWKLRVGSTDLLTADTTTSKLRVRFNRLAAFGGTVTVTTAANHALVFGTAGANQTELTSNFVLVINSSGADKDLRLPPIADLDGVPLTFFVTGGHGAVLKSSDGVTTIGTVANNKGAVVMNGSGDFGFIPGA